ncbi:MAG: hypothetical protein PHR62_10190 [Paludibacter sp.]|nr:hypothetical protein [Paludibacter sp.]
MKTNFIILFLLITSNLIGQPVFNKEGNASRIINISNHRMHEKAKSKHRNSMDSPQKVSQLLFFEDFSPNDSLIKANRWLINNSAGGEIKQVYDSAVGYAIMISSQEARNNTFLEIQLPDSFAGKDIWLSAKIRLDSVQFYSVERQGQICLKYYNPDSNGERDIAYEAIQFLNGTKDWHKKYAVNDGGISYDNVQNISTAFHVVENA